MICLLLSSLANATTFLDKSSELGIAPGETAACWADLDGDGWTDLVSGGAVWKNLGGKRFVKMASVGQVVAADFDNDGLVDLFSWSELKLYRNKNGEFILYPLPDLPKTASRGAVCADFNNDGFVDIYVGGYEHWETQATYPSLVLINKGGKSFELASNVTKYRARGVTACDFDRDGDADVYVSNYRLQPNLLLVNDGKGSLTDEAAKRNAVATSEGFDGGHSIGSAWGDFDGDGEFDLFAGNFAHVDTRGDQPKSRFLRNLGASGGYKFDDKGTCGVFYQESYASPAAADYDNDGDLDLFFTTVYASASFGRKNFPTLFRNDGGFKFVDATKEAGVAELGATYQAAWADFDRDGDLDLVSNGKLFVNQTSGTHWLSVQLVGDGKLINRSAVGAQVRIVIQGKTIARQVEAGTGEGNQSDLSLHFGLGSYSGLVDLEVTWPGGKVQRIADVKPDQFLRVTAP